MIYVAKNPSKEEIHEEILSQKEYCKNVRTDIKKIADFLDEYENVLAKIDSGEIDLEEGREWIENNDPEDDLDVIELC